MKYLRHKLSAAWPSMTTEEFAHLKADIAANGVRDPITILDQQVLDGWHRYLAAQETGKPCPHTAFPSGADAKAFVKSKHERRNITPAQRAVSMAEIEAWLSPGRPHRGKGDPGAGLIGNGAKTAQTLADSAGVSERTMQRAKAVVSKGAPEVIEAVREGLVSLKAAAEVVTAVPKNEQAVALIDPQSSAAKPLKRAKPQKAPAATGDVAKLEKKVAEQSDEVARLLEQLSECQEKVSEAASLLEELRTDLEAANKVIDATGDKRLRTALDEAKKWRDAYAAQEDRFRGLQNECNAAKRTAETWRRKASDNNRTKH